MGLEPPTTDLSRRLLLNCHFNCYHYPRPKFLACNFSSRSKTTGELSSLVSSCRRCVDFLILRMINCINAFFKYCMKCQAFSYLSTIIPHVFLRYLGSFVARGLLSTLSSCICVAGEPAGFFNGGGRRNEKTLKWKLLKNNYSQ